MTDVFEKTDKNRVKRGHEKALYDHETIHAIVDASPICHVGYAIDGQPYVTPTLVWRDGNRLFWHGSSASRMLRQVKGGIPVCVTASLFDGYVLARSPFHHTANFRAAMMFGHAQEVTDKDDKAAALDHMMDKLLPGRKEDVRANTDQEVKATTVVAMEIESASAKVRTGPPKDDAEDYEIATCWAGEIPRQEILGTPVPDPMMAGSTPFPDYLSEWMSRFA